MSHSNKHFTSRLGRIKKFTLSSIKTISRNRVQSSPSHPRAQQPRKNPQLRNQRKNNKRLRKENNLNQRRSWNRSTSILAKAVTQILSDPSHQRLRARHNLNAKTVLLRLMIDMTSKSVWVAVHTDMYLAPSTRNQTNKSR